MGHFLSRLRKCCHKAEFAIWSHRFFSAISFKCVRSKQEGKANYDGFAFFFFFFLIPSFSVLDQIRMVWCHFGFSLDRALAFVLFKNRPKRPVFFCAHFSPSVLLVIVVPKDSCGTDRLCLKITMGARWRESKEEGAGRWEFYHPQGSRYQIHKNKKNFKFSISIPLNLKSRFHSNTQTAMRVFLSHFNCVGFKGSQYFQFGGRRRRKGWFRKVFFFFFGLCLPGSVVCLIVW